MDERNLVRATIKGGKQQIVASLLLTLALLELFKSSRACILLEHSSQFLKPENFNVCGAWTEEEKCLL